MSAFRVTITVGEGDLGKVLAGLTRKQIADADIVPVKNEPAQDAPRVCPTGRAAGQAIVMKGDRTDAPRGPASFCKILHIHEKLEAKHGIGTITRTQLSKEAKKLIGSFRAAHISKLINEGFLVYVTGGE